MSQFYSSQAGATRLKNLFLLLTLAIAVAGCNWIELFSKSSSGEAANNNSYKPGLSGDGRIVVYYSYADNLSDSDINGSSDVFAHDTVTGITEQVSVDDAGVGGLLPSGKFDVSDSGRMIVFSSPSPELDEGRLAEDEVVVTDPNDPVYGHYLSDIYLRDRELGTTTRVNVNDAGEPANDYSGDPAISGNGRYVAFQSLASNLVPTGNNSDHHIYVRDTVAGLTSRVSVNSAGESADNWSYRPVLSANGRYVAFETLARNLSPGFGTGFQIYLHDRVSGETVLVSRDPAGNRGDRSSRSPVISADGRYVAFASEANNLVANDNYLGSEIYVFDRQTLVVSLISKDNNGNQIASSASNPSLSGDGRYVAYDTYYGGIVEEDTNSTWDAFVYDRVTAKTIRVSEGPLGEQGNAMTRYASLSADGGYVVFESIATNLAAGGQDNTTDIFVRALPVLTLSSSAPNIVPVGETTSVTFTGTNFLPGTTIGMNAAVSNVIVVNETTITADITVPASATPGGRNVMAMLSGTGPGSLTGASAACIDCLHVF